jgi:hypothetical protein
MCKFDGTVTEADGIFACVVVDPGCSMVSVTKTTISHLPPGPHSAREMPVGACASERIMSLSQTNLLVNVIKIIDYWGKYPISERDAKWVKARGLSVQCCRNFQLSSAIS